MKKYLLPQSGNFYKANLHCHSTVSDGRLTPAQLKDLYMAHGYSIIAYTDHNVMIPHLELKDEHFLPMTGYEVNLSEKDYSLSKDKKTCHICFVYLKDDEHPIQHVITSAYIKKVWDTEPHEGEEAPAVYGTLLTADRVNDIIRRGVEAGYFVTYNHPSWSLENYEDYMSYEGMHAMEIVNYGDLVVGYNDYNDRAYDDMLRGGKRIGCIATDDNHNRTPEGTTLFSSCGGWTVIKADKLEYEDIGKALLAGNYYASMGPSIKELWFEDGEVHIECSPATEINVICGSRIARRAAAVDEMITSATFDIPKEAIWFRLDVVDHRGKHADTIAYFTDSLPYPEEN